MTREGAEDGGWLLPAPTGSLRAWAVGRETSLDAPHRRGRAYRFSPMRAAGRVLLARGESVGLLTNGDELRLLLCDPARPDSHLTIALGLWRARLAPPDSLGLLTKLVGAGCLGRLGDVLDAARLAQTRVTQDLRQQARTAIEGFAQAVLDHPANAATLRDIPDLAISLWREGLVLIYRLLFILRLEATSDPARGFSFAATHLWRAALSPNQALGPIVRRHLDQGHTTGRMLEDGLRTLFRLFRDGLSSSELSIAALGGALFGTDATPLLDRLAWGESAVALLLDRLLWTAASGRGRERVHYGSLDVEDLGRIYEALLDLEPGITAAPMLRLRRAKREAVVAAAVPKPTDGSRVTAVETIGSGRFFLRAGPGRKATGSYYTPHELVRFLVRETLSPLLATRSPDVDPDPAALLRMKLVDPAVGSGHFLVEACRFLGEALYTACRLADEQAWAAEQAGRMDRAAVLRKRLAALPDPDGALASYLPSRTAEGRGAGVAQEHALALCRRMVAVHCLYGVDRNPLAVELAKLSLWLESYAEGLPLTFLDHRLVWGDSLNGPFFARMTRLPVTGAPLDPLLARGVADALAAARSDALTEVAALEATLGRDTADLLLKAAARDRLEARLSPLRRLAEAWSGAVMLAAPFGDDAWQALAVCAADGGWPARLTRHQAAILDAGQGALCWDLQFPEVFQAGGFDAVLGNPPWDVIQYHTKDFVAGHDLRVLDAATGRESAALAAGALADPAAERAFAAYRDGFIRQKRLVDRLYRFQRAATARGTTGGANLDIFRLFAERALELAGPAGSIGLLLPSAFHANEGTTALRRLYLDHARLELCLSFENRRKLFDIDSRFRFALLVARRPGPTRSLRCAFFLDRIEQATDPARLMTYDRAFLEQAGGDHLTFLELRGGADRAVAERLFAAPDRLGAWCRQRGIQFGNDLHMTADAPLFSPAPHAEAGWLRLHEGKTFHQFTDRWDTEPRYAVAPALLAGKPTLRAARCYRIAFRDIARSNDERTMIAAVLPPGVVCGHTATVERAPDRRRMEDVLVLTALFNAFTFDWLVRLKAGTHLSLYLLNDLPVPALSATAARFLASAALCLSCNHPGYAALWRAESGLRWAGVPLPDPAARWQVRAAADAAVARAYGLDRDDYRRVLAGFGHRSYPPAPAACLAAFDQLVDRGEPDWAVIRPPSVPAGDRQGGVGRP